MRNLARKVKRVIKSLLGIHRRDAENAKDERRALGCSWRPLAHLAVFLSVHSVYSVIRILMV